MAELVNHPAHYAAGRKLEPIAVIEAWGLDRSFCAGNALKYLSRAGRKEDILTDVRKTGWYLSREITLLAGQTPARRPLMRHNAPSMAEVLADWNPAPCCIEPIRQIGLYAATGETHHLLEALRACQQAEATLAAERRRTQQEQHFQGRA
ncbi:MAG: DUF3310 domain-containing protein [Roseomonas mucosa]|nr:DUF3310 domain-containing protein [Roseomonas mucosa]